MTERLGPYLLGPTDDANQGIYTGDAMALAEALPDESVDLILCDPIYWEIEQYAWLAKMAERVLKPGGNLLAQTCSEYRYDCEQAMRQSSLTPCPMLIEVLAGAPRRMWKYNLGQMCKPYLWFCKGKPTSRLGGYIGDASYGRGKDKSMHKWGDSESFFRVKVADFTRPEDLVLDPFTGGGDRARRLQGARA